MLMRQADLAACLAVCLAAWVCCTACASMTGRCLSFPACMQILPGWPGSSEPQIPEATYPSSGTARRLWPPILMGAVHAGSADGGGPWPVCEMCRWPLWPACGRVGAGAARGHHSGRRGRPRRLTRRRRHGHGAHQLLPNGCKRLGPEGQICNTPMLSAGPKGAAGVAMRATSQDTAMHSLVCRHFITAPSGVVLRHATGLGGCVCALRSRGRAQQRPRQPQHAVL